MTESDIGSRIESTRSRLESASRPAIERSGSPRIDPASPLARYFDHTMLKPEATSDQYVQLCKEARSLGTRSVCVPPDRISLCAELLQGSGVEVCTVIGFPLGYHTSSAKVTEVEMAVSAGATELDMVIPIGRMRDDDVEAVYDDVRAVVAASGSNVVKVILENALLDELQRIDAAVASIQAGADFIKTSTGFAKSGATIADLRMFRQVAGNGRGVKAAGGIRDLTFARACIEAGADRIGASATVSIVAEAEGRADASGTQGGDDY